MTANHINSTLEPVMLGVVGLGRAFMLMLPTFENDGRVCLGSAADPSKEKQHAFATQFDAPVSDDMEAMCADPRIEAIYIATPHETHRKLVIQALSSGKHVLVEKPMTTGVADAEAIVRAVEDGAKEVIVGPSHSFDVPIIETKKIISSGRYGPVGMINASYYTDFVFRPRRPEEMNTRLGGGAIYNQGAHHADIILALAGVQARSVYAFVGNLDPRRPCDGAYSALIEFENHCFASVTYSGYAHYDSDAEMDWISEIGLQKDPGIYGAARRNLNGMDETCEKEKRGFNQAGLTGESPVYNEHFGNILISCQRADIKPTPTGIHIYADETHDFIPLPPGEIPRSAVIDELHQLVRNGIPPKHSAQWGLKTTALCEGIYSSAELKRKVELNY